MVSFCPKLHFSTMPFVLVVGSFLSHFTSLALLLSILKYWNSPSLFFGVVYFPLSEGNIMLEALLN